MTRLSIYISLLVGVILPLALGQVAKDGKTFGWVGDVLFGNCQMSRCRTDFSRAQYCCITGKNTGCCTYSGGNWGNGGNNGGNWGNGGNNGGNWGNGGSNGNFNNNKPGTCPNYNGRKRRSPEQAPRGGSGGRNYGGSSSGRTFGNNNGGWNNGGQGFNPGYNNNNNNNGYGRCIRDSECPGSLKCCYLYNGYQCTQPQYYG